jgi:hypothetical protein
LSYLSIHSVTKRLLTIEAVNNAFRSLKALLSFIAASRQSPRDHYDQKKIDRILFISNSRCVSPFSKAITSLRSWGKGVTVLIHQDCSIFNLPLI